jgi:tetraacyldisaccharide 4'-kinase
MAINGTDHCALHRIFGVKPFRLIVNCKDKIRILIGPLLIMGIDKLWYSKNIISTFLLPLAWLFRTVILFRRAIYRLLNRFQRPLPVPVIVVGNITVGGTGKTPLVIWMAGFLSSKGFSPGIISRGYGGSADTWPQSVTSQSDPARVGDEPVLIASHCACPVFVAPKRIDAAKALLKQYQCDVLISDDGLQHYALMRDIEIAVLDGIRGIGNGYCLPAGPLRETAQRLKQVDYVVINGSRSVVQALAGNGYTMQLKPQRVVNLAKPDLTRSIEDFRGQSVYAIAGIGHPQRYFNILEEQGLDVVSCVYPDHYDYTPADLEFIGQPSVLMTEKDAIKIKRFAKPNYWYLPVTAEPDPEFAKQLIRKLKQRVESKRLSG